MRSISADALKNENLFGVNLPPTLRTIRERAFQSNALDAVVIPNQVTLIEATAFEFNNLRDITIGSSVHSILDFAFASNPIEIVRFLGPAPTTFYPRTNGARSLGDPAGMVITYKSKYDKNKVGGTNAFTAGKWMGYASKAIPILKIDRPKVVKDNTAFKIKVNVFKGSKKITEGKVLVTFRGKTKRVYLKKYNGNATVSFTSPNVGKNPIERKATITFKPATGKPLTRATATRVIKIKE